jgi:hypothetical protein
VILLTGIRIRKVRQKSLCVVVYTHQSTGIKLPFRFRGVGHSRTYLKPCACFWLHTRSGILMGLRDNFGVA